MDQPKNWTIYILQCQGGKYYVGKTQNPNFRLEQHFHSQGSQWTIKYKPIKIVKLIEKCDSFDEDKYTRICMQQYGIDNVRGGSYCQMELVNEVKEHLEREISGAKDLCFNCKKPGHFVRQCPEYKKKKEEEDNDLAYWDLIVKFFTEDEKVEEECKKCGRRGHNQSSCYAKTSITGKLLQNTSCSRCGRQSHSAKDCYAKTDIHGKELH